MAHSRHTRKRVALRGGGSLYARKGGVWWVDFTVAGSPRTRVSLGTADLKLAREKAELLVGAAHRGGLDKAMEGMGVSSAAALSIPEVVARYETAAKVNGLDPVSIHGNVLALRRLIRLGVGREPDEVRLSDLTREAMTAARAAMLEGVASSMRKRRDRSIASMLRQAGSVLGADYLHLYGRIPEGLAGWTGSTHKAEAIKYEPRPEVLVARTHAAAEGWAKAARGDGLESERARRFRVCYLLGYRLGMRPGEVASARWDWLEPDGRGGLLLRVEYKRRTRRIPVSADLLQELRDLGGEGHILPAPEPRHVGQSPEGIRKQVVERAFAHELRRLGWDAATYPKAAYELRKLAGSRWYTELGAERAAALLGHGNVAVTCQFYAALDRPLSAEQVDAVFTKESRHAG